MEENPMQCVLMGNGGIIFQAVAIGGLEMTSREEILE